MHGLPGGGGGRTGHLADAGRSSGAHSGVCVGSALGDGRQERRKAVAGAQRVGAALAHDGEHAARRDARRGVRLQQPLVDKLERGGRDELGRQAQCEGVERLRRDLAGRQGLLHMAAGVSPRPRRAPGTSTLHRAAHASRTAAGGGAKRRQTDGLAVADVLTPHAENSCQRGQL